MIIGIGIDIIEIRRIEEAVIKNDEFVNRVFSDGEINLFKSRNNRGEVIAGNFAAKEAIVKAMGTGFRNMEFKDIEILRDMLGKPYVEVHNSARNMLSDNCIIHISISHCHEYAVANAVIETTDTKDFIYTERIETSYENK